MDETGKVVYAIEICYSNPVPLDKKEDLEDLNIKLIEGLTRDILHGFYGNKDVSYIKKMDLKPKFNNPFPTKESDCCDKCVEKERIRQEQIRLRLEKQRKERKEREKREAKEKEERERILEEIKKLEEEERRIEEEERKKQLKKLKEEGIEREQRRKIYLFTEKVKKRKKYKLYLVARGWLNKRKNLKKFNRIRKKKISFEEYEFGKKKKVSKPIISNNFYKLWEKLQTHKLRMEKYQKFWDEGGYIWCEYHGCWNTNKRCNECSKSIQS